MENNNNGGSGLGTVAGVIMGIGALIAVIGSLFGKKDENQQPLYAIPREGPTVTDYTPQMPQQPQQPVVMRPNIPAPAYVPSYLSSYPWGYNAYIAAIANAPMQNQSMNYQYYPAQDMNCGYYYASPRVIEYNTDYGRGINYVPPKPYIPPAPPGNTQPQFAYNMNYGGTYYQQPQAPMYNMQQPAPQPTVTTFPGTPVQKVADTGNPILDGLFNNQQGPPQTSAQGCTYNFNKQSDAYQRTMSDGSVTAFNIPSCYDNNGNWKGWS